MKNCFLHVLTLIRKCFIFLLHQAPNVMEVSIDDIYTKMISIPFGKNFSVLIYLLVLWFAVKTIQESQWYKAKPFCGRVGKFSALLHHFYLHTITIHKMPESIPSLWNVYRQWPGLFNCDCQRSMQNLSSCRFLQEMWCKYLSKCQDCDYSFLAWVKIILFRFDTGQNP